MYRKNAFTRLSSATQIASLQSIYVYICAINTNSRPNWCNEFAYSYSANQIHKQNPSIRPSIHTSFMNYLLCVMCFTSHYPNIIIALLVCLVRAHTWCLKIFIIYGWHSCGGGGSRHTHTHTSDIWMKWASKWAVKRDGRDVSCRSRVTIGVCSQPRKCVSCPNALFFI